jgi:hypothetical protein
MAVYITGLLLLDRRQNGTRIAAWLPARAHDAINRLLRTHILSPRALMETVISWAKCLGVAGYLAIDDVVVEKPFSRCVPWVGWTYSTSQKRKVRGLHIVVLWCAVGWRIPVAFRIWRPKSRCRAKNYRKRTQLAWEMVSEVYQTELEITYITGDTLYSGGWLVKKINRLGLIWVGVLHPRTTAIYRNRRWSAASLGEFLKLKWRKRLQLRAHSIVAYLPKYGTLRLVVTRNRHGNIEVLATNDLDSDLTTIVLRKRCRWSIETLFRDTKQFAGLAALFEGVERGIIPTDDVPDFVAQADGLGNLEAAVQAVELLRTPQASEYPALYVVGDGPQAMAERYPGMQDIVFTGGKGTLANAGHCSTLWTFLMPFSRFFGHYVGQIYKIDEQLPSPDSGQEAYRECFERVVERMLQREFFWLLSNALSQCAFTFVIFSQDGEGERLSDDDGRSSSASLVRILRNYGIQTTRDDLNWFSQAFWAQSMDLKCQFGWRPPSAADFPQRVYEALSLALDHPPEGLQSLMEMLIGEWKHQAGGVMARFGYEVPW